MSYQELLHIPYPAHTRSKSGLSTEYLDQLSADDRFVEDYLDAYGTHGEVTIHTGASNTGWHHGAGFTQGTGSAAQRDALDRVARTSRHWI